MPNGNIYLSSKSSNSGKTGYLTPNSNGGYSWHYKAFSRLPEMASILSIYPEENGVVWIGSNEGLYRYDPSKDIKNYNLDFSCLIRKVTVGKDSVVYWGNFADQEKLKTRGIDNSLNSIKFNYAAPFFDREERTKYSYIFEGFDDNWSDWTTSTSKEYTKVKEGTYTFKVKAINIYGKESSTAQYTVTFLAPWFRTWWAYLLYGLIVLSLYILFSRYYSRVLIAQKNQTRKNCFRKNH